MFSDVHIFLGGEVSMGDELAHHLKSEVGPI
jgi:hypothetical protein